MIIYYVASSRKICENADQAVAQAVKEIGISYLKNDERYEVSKPMIIKSHGDCFVVVTIYDLVSNKLKVRKRRIDIINTLKSKWIDTVDYLGKID